MNTPFARRRRRLARTFKFWLHYVRLLSVVYWVEKNKICFFHFWIFSLSWLLLWFWWLHQIGRQATSETGWYDLNKKKIPYACSLSLSTFSPSSLKLKLENYAWIFLLFFPSLYFFRTRCVDKVHMDHIALNFFFL